MAGQPELKSQPDSPLFAFGTPAIACAASRGYRGVIDVLVDAGADINARSDWWAGSFGALDSADATTSTYLIQRGANSMRMQPRGWMDRQAQELVAADPGVVHARGGDGQTPLHFAAPSRSPLTCSIMAPISTPAISITNQRPRNTWSASHPDVVRYLISRGAKTDLLLASAIGDLALVRRHLDENPDSMRMRVSGAFFPMKNPRAGGTIYIWTLGTHRSAHSLARKFGHREVLDLLLERSSPLVKFVDACLEGDRARALALAGTPLDDGACGEISTAAEDNNTRAVTLMLELGWPVAGGGVATPLHWAGFHGNPEMAREILRYSPPLEQRDPEYKGTPLDWAVHGSEHGWYCKTGDYAGVVKALLDAGAAPPEQIAGSEAVRQALTAGRPPRTA